MNFNVKSFLGAAVCATVLVVAPAAAHAASEAAPTSSHARLVDSAISIA